MSFGTRISSQWDPSPNDTNTNAACISGESRSSARQTAVKRERMGMVLTVGRIPPCRSNTGIDKGGATTERVSEKGSAKPPPQRVAPSNDRK